METSGNHRKTASSASERPPQGVKFTRRTSSGRVVSLSRDEDLDMSGDFSGQNDYINYTVMMPPTPDNQPMGEPPGVGPGEIKADNLPRPGDAYGGGSAASSKMDRRMSVTNRATNKSILLRSQTADFDHNRWLFDTKGKYGIGNAFWSPEEGGGDYEHGPEMSMADFMDKPWKPLTRKVKVPPGVLSPYRYNSFHHGNQNFCCKLINLPINLFFFLYEKNRLLVVIRLVTLVLFLIWRVQNPNPEAMWLWGMSIVCEIWFAFSWVLDQLPKLNPINRAADLAALHEKFEKPSVNNPEGRSDLPGVDFFVSTADPEKEPPLVTANTILSILAADYPVEKLACYISDDGGAILTFEAMAEAVNFAQVEIALKLQKHSPPTK